MLYGIYMQRYTNFVFIYMLDIEHLKVDKSSNTECSAGLLDFGVSILLSLLMNRNVC